MPSKTNENGFVGFIVWNRQQSWLGDRVNDKMLCTLSFVLENYSIKTAHVAASSRAALA